MHKRGFTFAALCLAAAIAFAREVPPAPAAVPGSSSVSTSPPTAFLPLVAIDRQGYAFEYPRVLVRQKLFGITHGVSLLATACKDVSTEAEHVAKAYVEWHERQQTEIEAVQQELARFYYGTRANEATTDNLVRALNLRESINLAPESEQLSKACESLPDALQQSRYDIAAIFRMEEALVKAQFAARIDTQTTVCNDRLPVGARTLLIDRYAAWQLQNGQPVAAARSYLQTHWDARFEGTPAAWLAKQELRYANPPQTRCAELADWLTTAEAAVESSFAPAPDLPVLSEQATPAVSAEATTATTISSSSGVVQKTEETPKEKQADETADTPEQLDNPLVDLFDYFMKVLNDPTPKPARSQRAHP